MVNHYITVNSGILTYANWIMKEMAVTKFVFELSSLAKIRGVSKMLYCCYGNLLCKTFHQNLLINDWTFV